VKKKKKDYQNVANWIVVISGLVLVAIETARFILDYLVE
jgi:hypothetical protein